MNAEKKILKLISQIDKGNASPESVTKKISRIKAQGGKLDILYNVEERYDQEYYDELLADARIGIYNSNSLIRMSEIKYQAKNNKKILFIIGGGTVAILIVALVIILGRAKS